MFHRLCYLQIASHLDLILFKVIQLEHVRENQVVHVKIITIARIVNLQALGFVS